MKKVIVLLALMAVFLAACKKEEPPPPPPENLPPPPPSAEEIYSGELAPIITLFQGVSAAVPLDDMTKNQALSGLRAAKGTHQTTPNGPAALARLTNDFDGLITQAKQQSNWPLLAAACEAFDILQPGNAKTRIFADIAAKQLAKPQVRIKGFHEDNTTNQKYVLLEVKLPGTDWKSVDAVRVGEEFLDAPNTLRLVEIIGNNEGIRLEYLGIPGDVFDVKKGS